MIDFFKEINRSLTALISGGIAGGILVAIMYFSAEAFGATDLKFMLVSYFGFYIAILISQILQLYFYKLLDRDAYGNIGTRIFKLAIVDLIFLVIAFPFLFLINAGNGFQLILVSLVFFLHLLSSIVRENGNESRLISNLAGTFGVMLVTALMLTNVTLTDTSSLLMQTSQVGILIPVVMFIGSIFEFIGILIVKIVNPTNEEPATSVNEQ